MNKIEIGGIVFDTKPKYTNKIEQRLIRIKKGKPNLFDFKYTKQQKPF